MDIQESDTIDLVDTTSTTSPLPTCYVGDTLSGRYRLDEEKGRGGMGVVFRAWDVELERPVAVKVLAVVLEAEDAHERLVREARAAAALSHPNVVAVHDVGVHEVALEYCRQFEEILEGTDESINPVWVGPTHCGSLVAIGKLEEAERRLEETLEATRRAGMPHWEGMALKIRGQLNAVRDDPEAAREDFDAAIHIFEDLGSRLELGRTLVLRRAGGDLERARELFAACGAAGDLAKLPS